MAVPVVMPRQGQSVESCVITQWVKNKGDQVNAGDILFSYETDKASFEAEADVSGTLLDVFFEEGDEVPVLTTVAVIGKPGETYERRPADAKKPEESVMEKAPPATRTDNQPQEIPGKTPRASGLPPNEGETGRQMRKRISPLARRIAAMHHVDTRGIDGTGPKGRIIERDIRDRMLSAGKAGTSFVPEKQPPVHSTASIDGAIASTGGYTDHAMSNVRKIIAAKMAESLQTAAQLTHHISADARKLLALRKEAKENSVQTGGISITINDMVCYAAVRALKKHPGINGHFLGDRIRTFDKVHLGVAVDTDRGLMVPVLKNADDLNVQGLSARLKQLANDCKEGVIDPGLLSASSASFTVTNLGAFGIELFTPVLNIPQIAILGVNAITYKPCDLGGGTIGLIPVIGLSLTYDHRAVDGAPASRFLSEIKYEVEHIQ